MSAVLESVAAPVRQRTDPSDRIGHVVLVLIGAVLAVFLASEAAKSITGAAIPIEGGWTAR